MNLPLISSQSDFLSWCIFRFVLIVNMLNYGIFLGGGHFHWKLILEKAFLHEPDGYGEQPSLQVNFLVLKDHESSGVNDSLRLGTKNNHRQAFEWAVEQVRQEYYPRGSLTRF